MPLLISLIKIGLVFYHHIHGGFECYQNVMIVLFYRQLTSLPITVTVWSVYGSFSSFSPSQSWNFFMSYGVKCNSYDDLTTSIEADGSNTIASPNSLSGKRTMSVYSGLPSNSVF